MIHLDERYELTARIGRGGVGEVFEGVQKALDRRVAIKLLRPELTVRPEVVARFEQEARTTCRLQHPNVVTVFDVGTAPSGQRFLVMELLEGVTLAQLMRREGPLRPQRAVDLGLQVARGMGAGQGVGLVHRDLKPENITVLGEPPDERVKILDFGLAFLQDQAVTEGSAFPDRASIPEALRNSVERLPLGHTSQDTLTPPPGPLADQTWDGVSWHGSSQDVPTAETPQGMSDPTAAPEPLELSPARLTSPGALVGTPRYMSPEQALCWKVDHRADLYAFGCVLYEMLAGRAPFEEESVQDYLQAHVHKEPPPLGALVSDCPGDLVELVYRLLAKDPDQRPRDWAEVIATLTALQRRPTAQASRTRSLQRPTEPFRFLAPFSESTSELFFGRDGDSRRFLEIWQHPDRPPVVAITGRSGVGKTSFLYARIVPALAQLEHELLVVRGGQDPLSDLRAQARRLLSRSTASAPNQPMAEILDTLSLQLGRPVCLVMDQLEELFTGGSGEQQRAFAEGLHLLLRTRSDTRVLFSLREDYLGALLRTLDDLPLDELFRTMPLRPLARGDILEALSGPGRPGLAVDYAPFSFEDGLLEEIVDDLLADPAGEVAPRIQAVGSRLWELAKDQTPVRITRAHYRQGLGGARGILARILDEAIAGLEDAAGNQAKEILRALTHLPGSATSRPAPESELLRGVQDVSARKRVLRQLENRWRLIQGFTDPRYPGERSYRIAHEALIQRIQQYGEESGERNAARHRFQLSFDLWLRGGQRDEELLPVEFFDVVQRHADSLVLRTEAEEEFLRRSRELHNDSWLEQQLLTRRRSTQRKLMIGAMPVAFLMLGVVVGQLPENFHTIDTLRAHARSALHSERARLGGTNLLDLQVDQPFFLGAQLQSADLRFAQLVGADLEQADLSYARLEGADLRGASLLAANLSQAKLEGAHFEGAQLRMADFSGCDVSQAHWLAATFDENTVWPGMPPHGAFGPTGHADGVDLSGREFTRRMSMERMGFMEANFEGATFANGTVMDKSQLQRLDAQGVTLQGVSLREAHLDEADLRNANLRTIKARRAHFDGANLRGADLRNAELAMTFFTGADLRDADLRGANLRDAHLEGARLKGALWNESTVWPEGFNPAPRGAVETAPQ